MPSPETANVGKAVAARVGRNIREVRTRLDMTQSKLAAPEFSISYISAIENGKIRPSLKALSVLARRLDVPLTFLLEGSPSDATEARAIGYSLTDSGPDPRIDVDLLQAEVLIQQGNFHEAKAFLSPIQPDRITTDQVYRLYLLRGQMHLGAGEYQEAIVDLRSALSQGENLNESEYTERARSLLGNAYFALHNSTLALEHHLRCNVALEQKAITDPFFSLDVYTGLANDYFRIGDLDKATSFYRRALDILDGFSKDTRSFAQKYMEMGQHYKSIGKLLLARDYIMKSLTVSQMRDEQCLVGLTHQRLGKTFERHQNLDSAEQEYREAIALERDLHDEGVTSLCHTSLSELLLKQNRVEEAEDEAQEALRSAEQGNDPQIQGQALIALAEIRHRTQDDTGEDEFFTHALELLETANAFDVASAAYFRYATMLEERNEVQRSLNAIKKAFGYQQQDKRGNTQ
jgi:tetratricopeptide (TPR) repeat protein